MPQALPSTVTAPYCRPATEGVRGMWWNLGGLSPSSVLARETACARATLPLSSPLAALPRSVIHPPLPALAIRPVFPSFLWILARDLLCFPGPATCLLQVALGEHLGPR